MSFGNEGRLSINCPKQIGPYVFRGTMGDGAFSVVKLVLNQDTHNFYACKIVPMNRINTESLKIRFETEIHVNQQLHHPGIVELYDLLKDENNYYVIMEFCPNGELFQYINDRTRLSEHEAKPFIRQILETLQYIHSMNISHRDLKPENLLISQTGMIKFSDFGLSSFIPSDGLLETPCGSPCYVSPECISGKPYDGKTTDVWSCGVILYAMLTGQLPWTKRNQTQLFAQIKRGEYQIPGFLSDKCRNFIRSLLTVDVSKRITIEEALNNEWLRSTPVQYVGFVNCSTNKPKLQSMPSACITLKKVDRFFGRDTMSTQEELEGVSKRIIIGKPKVQIENLQSTSNSISNSFEKSASSRQFSFKQVSKFIKDSYLSFNFSNPSKAASMFELEKLKITPGIPSIPGHNSAMSRNISNHSSYSIPQVSFMKGAIQTSSKGGARKYVMSSSSMRLLSQAPKKNPNQNPSSNTKQTTVIKKTVLMKPKVKKNSDV